MIIEGYNNINNKSFESFIKDIFDKHNINYKDKKYDNVSVVFGWHLGHFYRSLGYEVLIFEFGYLGDRMYNWFSIGWNNLGNRGDYKLSKNFIPTGRFNKFFKLKNWKNDGDKIIITGQIAQDMSILRQDLTNFYEKIAELLYKEYNLPIFFKPHPNVVEKKKKGDFKNNQRFIERSNFAPNINLFKGDMNKALEEAVLIATFNSNSAVDAVINGVPVMTFDKGSMAWDVTSHKISEIIKPDRSLWAEKLAHCQWSVEEIENGEWLKRLFFQHLN